MTNELEQFYYSSYTPEQCQVLEELHYQMEVSQADFEEQARDYDNFMLQNGRWYKEKPQQPSPLVRYFLSDSNLQKEYEEYKARQLQLLPLAA